MKVVILSGIALLLAGCGIMREYRYPDRNTALKVYEEQDRLIIENTQYGGFYEITISELDAVAGPNKTNTAPYRDFQKVNLAAEPNREIPVIYRWSMLSKNKDGYKLTDFEGNPLPSGRAVYFLNTEKIASDYFGYAVVRPSHQPIVFYVKPEIRKSRESPGFMGWSD